MALKLQPRTAVDVAQSGVVCPGGSQLAGQNGSVAAHGGHLPVDTEEVQPPVLWYGVPGQGGVLPVGCSKGAAVDHSAQGGKFHSFHLGCGKDVYIGGPLGSGVGGLGGVGVMVAGGDEDGDGQLPQGLGEGLNGLGVDPLGIQQISPQQHQICPLRLGQLGQTAGEVPQFPPPLGGLGGGEAAEGGVQVEVRGV